MKESKTGANESSRTYQDQADVDKVIVTSKGSGGSTDGLVYNGYFKERGHCSSWDVYTDQRHKNCLDL